MVNQKNGENQMGATLSSNNGWNSLALTLKKALWSNTNKFFLTEIAIIGNFWDREKSLISILEAELINDYKVYLPQVLLSEAKIKDLIGYLEAWLIQYTEFDFELSSMPDQKLSVFIGVRDDFISKFDHPVFSIRYFSPNMKAEWSFIIDQSCLNLFLEGLQIEISKISNEVSR